jgi:L-ascorbate metabolism protein UlaG (beta-lactamase superfamily)
MNENRPLTPLTIQPLGGPTAVLEYAGLRWLTDSSLSPPGEYTVLVKTRGPAVEPEAIEPVDVVLLSHDQHGDNLSSDHAADAAKILGVQTVVPVHYEGWAHFTQGAEQLRAAFAGNSVTDRLLLIEPGAMATLEEPHQPENRYAEEGPMNVDDKLHDQSRI